MKKIETVPATKICPFCNSAFEGNALSGHLQVCKYMQESVYLWIEGGYDLKSNFVGLDVDNDPWLVEFDCEGVSIRPANTNEVTRLILEAERMIEDTEMRLKSLQKRRVRLIKYL